MKIVLFILLFTVFAPVYSLHNPLEGWEGFDLDLDDDFVWCSIDLSSSQSIEGDSGENEPVKLGFSLGYEIIISLPEKQTYTGGFGIELLYPNILKDGNKDEKFYFLPLYLCFQWHPFNSHTQTKVSPYFVSRLGRNVNPGGKIYYGVGFGILVNTNNPWRVELKYDEYWGRESYIYMGGDVDIRHKRLCLMFAYAFN